MKERREHMIQWLLSFIIEEESDVSFDREKELVGGRCMLCRGQS